MDVYDLILDKGIVGAIAYANKIDRTNYRLASKIDFATQDLLKTAQFQQMQFMQPTAPPAQLAQSAPTASPQLMGPEKQITDEELVRVFGPDILKEKPVQGGPDWLKVNNTWGDLLKSGLAMGLTPHATRDWVRLMSLNKIAPLVTELQNPNLNTFVRAEKIKELTDIIDKAPGPLKTSLSKTPINVKGDLINKILYSTKNPQFADDVLRGVLDSSTVRNGALHPILKSNTLFKQEIERLVNQKLIKVTDLAGKTIPELEEMIIANNGTVPKLPLLRRDPRTVKFIVEAGEGAKAGKIGGLMEAAAQKFPFLKTVLPFVAKIAGPLFVALSAKNLYDDYVMLNGKVDNKWWCEFLACLASIAALVPPLTPIAGPIALALNVGCMFVGREEKIDPSKLMPSDYKKRMGDITREQLSQKDVGMVDSLFSEYSSDKKLLQQSFEAIKGKFDNPLDAGAYLMKRYKEIGESGEVQQSPTNIESLRGSLTPEQFNLVKSTMPAAA